MSEGLHPQDKKYLTRSTFGKEEKLCSHKEIQELFANGSSFFFYPFKIFYQPSGEVAPTRVLFAVPRKRIKKANQRNIVKRRCKEAYRLHKKDFYQDLFEQKRFYDIIFVYVANEVLPYDQIEHKLKSILRRLSTKSTKTKDNNAQSKN